MNNYRIHLNNNEFIDIKADKVDVYSLPGNILFITNNEIIGCISNKLTFLKLVS